MGMPITIEIVDKEATQEAFDKVFDYFEHIDETFSTFKPGSEISKINRGEITREKWSEDIKLVFDLAEKTKNETSGYFDIVDNNGKYKVKRGNILGADIYCCKYFRRIILHNKLSI